MIFITYLTFVLLYSRDNWECELLDEVGRLGDSCLLEEIFGLASDHLPGLFFIPVAFLQDKEGKESEVDYRLVSSCW